MLFSFCLLEIASHTEYPLKIFHCYISCIGVIELSHFFLVFQEQHFTDIRQLCKTLLHIYIGKA